MVTAGDVGKPYNIVYYGNLHRNSWGHVQCWHVVCMCGMQYWETPATCTCYGLVCGCSAGRGVGIRLS